MPILKRRLDICGRERSWEYLIDSGGRQYHVTARQVGRQDPEFACSCGFSTEEDEDDDAFSVGHSQPCNHVAEAQRDLSIARQAAAQMIP